MSKCCCAQWSEKLAGANREIVELKTKFKKAEFVIEAIRKRGLGINNKNNLVCDLGEDHPGNCSEAYCLSTSRALVIYDQKEITCAK